MQLVWNITSDRWSDFLQNQEWSPFLQAPEMGEAYARIGQQPIRMGVEEGGELLAICQAVEVPARRGRHLMVQYGPVVMENEKLKIENCVRYEEMMHRLVTALKAEAKKRGCGFIRVSPFWALDDACIGSAQWKQWGFRLAPMHLLAEHVWYLDLSGKTEEDIFDGMRKNTRNLIRRAEREGVVVTASKNPMEDLEIFFDLYRQTCTRHRFVPYPESLIRAQVAAFLPQNMCRVYIARYQGEPIASSVHMVYGGETSYHHGASSVKHPKTFASYLLQWTAIKEAIARGDHIYNFWGIAPSGKEKDKHPFAGVTLFKTGFGGQALNLMPCMDLPVSSRYWFTYAFEKLRKWKRGF